jgi:hypothetical protein
MDINTILYKSLEKFFMSQFIKNCIISIIIILS